MRMQSASFSAAEREELDRQVTRLKQEREGLLAEIEAAASTLGAPDRG